MKWVFPVAGLFSLLWFLIRVIPKPSRATYPCQRVAAPLAGSFVIWLAGIIGSAMAYRRAKVLLQRSRYVLAAILVAAAVLAVWLPLSITADKGARAAFTPSDPPNSPMGIGKGIYPGRVVWVHEPDATSWDGSTGKWWDENNTGQDVVNYMVSQALRSLAGQSNDAGAWNALFRHFNRTRGLGDTGYQQGEKIAIKINMNQDTGGTWGPGSGMPSPQVIHSLLDQLIHVAGVPGSAITIYDASRYIGDPIYDKVRGNPDPNFQAVRFEVSPSRAGNGRYGVVQDSSSPICYGNPNVGSNGRAYPPRCVTEAKYLINLALFRQHSMFAVTLCGKNHFGSTYFPSNGGWTPEPMHNYGRRENAMGTYSVLVDLIGHKQLGGKTLLYMIDGLYSGRDQSSNVIKFASFGDDWCSSLFASQDPVAIDSVGLDFLRDEATATQVYGSVDNYLHEAAQADNPPSKTFYDPEGDKTRLESLGVHEHWNNPTDKKYSRNLGTGNGIELVAPPLTSPDGPVENVTKGVRYNYIHHAIKDADPGDQIVVHLGIYREGVDFGGKNLVLRSANPNDPAVVAATIIEGSNQAAAFSGGEGPECVLAGFTLTRASRGIYCSGASPRIRDCRIVENKGPGIKLWNQSSPVISNCLIAGNTGAGIDMSPTVAGRFVKYNHADIASCTIIDNKEHGVYGSIPTIASSIVYGNGANKGGVQIEAYSPVVVYSDVQGGWPGSGNISDDPNLVTPGHWVPGQNPGEVWVPGDCHLRAKSPCINAGDPGIAAAPGETDMDGEPRVMGGRIDMGSDEVGPKQADFTRNGTVDSRDLQAFVRAWLCNADDDDWNVLYDLYEDGHVDSADLAELSRDWLWKADWYSQ